MAELLLIMLFLSQSDSLLALREAARLILESLITLDRPMCGASEFVGGGGWEDGTLGGGGVTGGGGGGALLFLGSEHAPCLLIFFLEAGEYFESLDESTDERNASDDRSDKFAESAVPPLSVWRSKKQKKKKTSQTKTLHSVKNCLSCPANSLLYVHTEECAKRVYMYIRTDYLAIHTVPL